MGRKSIGKKLRFEVYKRDKFTCQYCGRSSPEVVLQVDHIEPVSKGGTNDILNLVTACWACNAGKGDRRLSDDSTIAKSRAQLEELQERREQLEMMIQWRSGLLDLEQDSIEGLVQLWKRLAPGWALNQNGRTKIRKLLGDFSYQEICDAMETAARHYLVYLEDGTVTGESFDNAWATIGAICRNARRDQDDPTYKDLLYIRATLRGRGLISGRSEEGEALDFLMEQRERGASVERMKRLARSAPSWYRFQCTVTEDLLEEK